MKRHKNSLTVHIAYSTAGLHLWEGTGVQILLNCTCFQEVANYPACFIQYFWLQGLSVLFWKKPNTKIFEPRSGMRDWNPGTHSRVHLTPYILVLTRLWKVLWDLLVRKYCLDTKDLSFQFNSPASMHFKLTCLPGIPRTTVGCGTYLFRAWCVN